MDHPVFSAIMTSKAIDKFRSENPERMGVVGGYTFYECPRRGDESPLYATDGNGTWGRTWHWEVPHLDEIAELAAA